MFKVTQNIQYHVYFKLDPISRFDEFKYNHKTNMKQFEFHTTEI